MKRPIRKKGRTPREVVAQLLEYAAWASDLSDEDIAEIAGSYFRFIENDQSLEEAFLETFEAEEIPVKQVVWESVQASLSWRR